MINKYRHQRFISGLLVALSVTSLVLLRLQVWVSATGSSKGSAALPDMNSRFGGWAYYAWPDMAQVSLLLTLVMIAMIALFNLRMSRRPEDRE
jgi:hypothetical protein